MKEKYYTKYNTDEDRMANRPTEIPLEDFKLLLKYWEDESVQVVSTLKNPLYLDLKDYQNKFLQMSFFLHFTGISGGK